MSGWIKFEKDLRTDPRFLRMCKAYVTQERINPVMAATLLSGGLLNLWCYADTHIREDDTLDIGADEIDELIGVKGFAALMPIDWLEVLDTHRVKLPGFQEHNGTDAKKKALTQKRVARHRVRSVTQVRSNNSPGGNGGALPDQTRLDQKRPDKKEERARGSEEFDESYATVEAIKLEYPKGTYKAAMWQLAQRQVWDRLDEGSLPDDLILAAKLYREQIRATKSEGTQFVKSPQNFYDISGYWRGPFHLPPTKAEAAQDANVAASREWLEKTSAAN